MTALRLPLALFLTLCTALGWPALPALAQPETRLERLARIDDPDALGVGRFAPDVTLTLLSGERRTLSSFLEGRTGLVIAMTSAGCPVSSKYAPRLAALHRESGSRQIPVVLVNAVPAESIDDMRSHVRDSGYLGPYAVDRDLSMAKALGARTTAEVFLLDAQRRVVYRGAFDDQFGVGSMRSTTRRAFLRDAMSALRAGRVPAVRATVAPGCLLDIPDEPSRPAPEAPAAPVDAPKAAPAPTYFGSVAAIIERSCVECHRLGGVAPFALDSFPLINGRASMIEAVVRDGIMPPTHRHRSGPGTPAYEGVRELAAADRDELLAWLRAGRPAGEPRPMPRTPPPSPTWRIGPPDSLLITPGVAVSPDEPLAHARRVLTLDADADRLIQAVELRPVERNSIHHALVWVLPPGSPLPERGAMPPAPEFLGAFGVGDGLIRYAEGEHRRIPAGSLLVVDVYARTMSRAMASSLRLAFRDASAPGREVRSLLVHADLVDLAPGEGPVRVSASRTLDRAVEVRAMWPQMRWRGESLTLRAVLPDGEERVLLDLPAYDVRWQVRYALRDSLHLPAGTRLLLDATFDNRETHPGNPDPGARVRLGPGIDDELCLVSLDVIDAE
jgi:mono/diheme cytochrome c family protein